MVAPPGHQAPPPPTVKRSNTTVIWVVVILAVAAFCIVALLVGAAVLFPVFNQAKLAAQRTACLSNVKQVALGALMYTSDWDDRLPMASNWADSTLAYTKSESAYRCPALARSQTNAYGLAYNLSMEKKPCSQLKSPENTILFFETAQPEAGVFGGEEMLARPGRHPRSGGVGSNFAYASGEARFVEDGIPAGVWKP